MEGWPVEGSGPGTMIRPLVCPHNHLSPSSTINTNNNTWSTLCTTSTTIIVTTNRNFANINFNITASKTSKRQSHITRVTLCGFRFCSGTTKVKHKLTES